ncbi:MAG: ParB/RepB/Spo0J family partition protein [bacterium]
MKRKTVSEYAGRKVLGRGLESLIPVREKGRIHSIDVSEIKPSKYQARRKFNNASILSLAQTIKEDGLIQPIIVTPSGNGWRLIAGERRLRAAKASGLKEIPAIIRDTAEENIAVLSLVENLQREDLMPLDEARALSHLMKKFSFTQEEVAVKTGKSRSAVANTLRLLKFPAVIVNALEDGSITEGHARALAAINDERRIKYLITKIIREHISVRDVEQTAFPVRQAKKRRGPAEIPEFAEKLESALGTKVEVKINRKKQGFIKIYFFSGEELERITHRLSR